MKKIVVLILFLTISSFSADEREDMTIHDIWNEYITYWSTTEPSMTNPKSCKPQTQNEIAVLEKNLNIKLPKDFYISLQTVDHNSKKCDDNRMHSWFGSTTGIVLFNTKEIWNHYKMLLSYVDINEEGVNNKYFGDIKPYTESEKWSKEWIPLLAHNGITFCLDLRSNIGEQYGQVLAVYPGIALGKNGNEWYNYIVFIAKDYKEFMKKMIDDIKSENGLTNDYFRKLMHLPSNYSDDDWGA